ncbi:AfsR/SARP family transcriptional regulator [Streptomyces sp. HPF1205]|uniref:AfsR/SARP family transcriptional regulator n=1 Tax=Streptomyces sp. HPF1205 TaxID=2873262 RepID=UPI001CEC838C|nr:AfsR/SARP family transcriptional regulator [Streptomyces sp. HPF1205]
MTPKASKQRKLLAVLLLNVNHMVRVNTLMGELWDSNPPRSAAATLQTYVSQLRRFLAAAADGERREDLAGQVLLTEPGGYVLRSPQALVDFARFEQKVGQGRLEAARHNYDAAAACLRDATSGWTGQVLENVAHGPVVEVQVRRLEQLWLSSVEQRFEIELRLGRHREILPDLTGVAAANPLHENLHGQLMTALHRSGRRAAALESFRALRGRLVDELGLEPTDHLERLHQEILANHRVPGEIALMPAS